MPKNHCSDQLLSDNKISLQKFLRKFVFNVFNFKNEKINHKTRFLLIEHPSHIKNP